MITIKVNPYNKTEIKVLRDALAENSVELMSKYCTQFPYCPSCPVRHLCNDLHANIRYLDCVLSNK